MAVEVLRLAVIDGRVSSCVEETPTSSFLGPFIKYDK
jgi:hypothetical protein